MEGARSLYAERCGLTAADHARLPRLTAIECGGRLAGFYAGVGLNSLKLLPEIVVRGPVSNHHPKPSPLFILPEGLTVLYAKECCMIVYGMWSVSC